MVSIQTVLLETPEIAITPFRQKCRVGYLQISWWKKIISVTVSLRVPQRKSFSNSADFQSLRQFHTFYSHQKTSIGVYEKQKKSLLLEEKKKKKIKMLFLTIKYF